MWELAALFTLLRERNERRKPACKAMGCLAFAVEAAASAE